MVLQVVSFVCYGDVKGMLEDFYRVLQKYYSALQGRYIGFTGILHICYMGVPRGVQGVLKSSYRVVI